jgi:hypothetical protein
MLYVGNTAKLWFCADASNDMMVLPNLVREPRQIIEQLVVGQRLGIDGVQL